jgi:hypothetical protein
MANIELANPGRVALVEMHVSSSYAGYGMYLYEARQRMFFYPAPHYQGGWGYYTPYLWYDGHKGSVSYSTWQSKINTRMNIPSPVTITMWGDWWPAAGTGTIYAQFRNDSTATLTGNVLFVATEDSIIIRNVPNGDTMHNHVARDYLPTNTGEIVSVPAGDSITLSRTFALQPTWKPDMIEFVTWIQDLNMNPEDSTIEIWQGGILDIDELGIEEYGNNEIAQAHIIPIPNPAVNATRFSFTLPDRTTYRIAFYDVSGRKIKTLTGIASGNEESVEWNLRNEQGTRVSAGVYLYRFESSEIETTGKVVVR